MPRHHQAVRIDTPSNSWLQGDWSYTDPKPDFAVVYAHGFCSIRSGEKAQAFEAECSRRGWPFATFDFHGHGDSGGTMRDLRPGRLLSDLAAVREYLKGQGVRRFCLVGSSMGGWAASWFTVKYPGAVTACALLAPGFRFPFGLWQMLTDQQRESWKRDGLLRLESQWADVELEYGLIEEAQDYTYDALVKAYNTPAILFQGCRDELVPFQRSVTFLGDVAVEQLELHLYKEGDHRLTAQKDQIAQEACNYFARQLFH